MEMVLFSSKNCGVCVALKPKLEKIARQFKLELREVVMEENPTEAAQAMVFSAPTVLLVENNRELQRWSGIFSTSEIEAFLQRAL